MGVAAAQVAIDLQVAPGRGVHHHAVLAALGRQRGDVRRPAALRVVHVADQAARRGYPKVQFRAAEAAQIVGLKLLAQRAHGLVEVELPGRLRAGAGALGKRRLGQRFVIQQLGRSEAFQLAEQGFVAGHFHNPKAPAGQVQVGDAEAALLTGDRHQQSLVPLFQKRFIAERSRGDDAHHLAFHGAFGGGRIADLFGNRHRQARANEAGEIGFGGVIGHAGHGNVGAGGFAAGGEGNIEQLRGALGVLVEQLVEIAHAIEEQLVGVVALDAQILAHHGAVLAQIAGQSSGWVPDKARSVRQGRGPRPPYTRRRAVGRGRFRPFFNGFDACIRIAGH